VVEEEERMKVQIKSLKIKRKEMNIKMISKRKNWKNSKRESTKILQEISKNKKFWKLLKYNATNINKICQKT
jgi:hypothetical protein